ncbi:MAG: aminopeptidase [Lentisphaeria bacterium]
MKRAKPSPEKTAVPPHPHDNGWHRLPAREREAVQAYAAEYRTFLSAAKTEREAYGLALAAARPAGFRPLEDCRRLTAGDKVWVGGHGRTLLLAVIGRRPLPDGLRIVGAHTDAPRLDAKPAPLYEDGGLGWLDTRYYGGIKKYQWVTLPLALHGVIVRQDGSAATVAIGEEPGDPVFTITDLLPHLGKEQDKKTLEDGIKGENLNVLFGSHPAPGGQAKDPVKAALLALLQERYAVSEEDLGSADLEIVPAGPARDLGLDRSMILGYGQDDRVCAFAGLRALLDLDGVPEHTAVVLLCDKEEIGSIGATGMDSLFFENAVAELLHRADPRAGDLGLRRALARSKMLSADVAAAHDPNYPDVSAPHENMARINGGLAVSKYGGGRGKSGASEASAEFTAEVRRIFNTGDVLWQTGELGKVDAGGGGTIAKFLARYGMDVVDCGVPLLSMHAPWEVAGKLDAYMAWKGYRAFLAS